MNWLARCSCRWSDLIDNNLSNLLSNSVIKISLLPWLLLLYGPLHVSEAPLSSIRCSDAPLSRDSGRFGSSIASNISSSFFCFLFLSVLVTLIVSQVLPSIIPLLDWCSSVDSI